MMKRYKKCLFTFLLILLVMIFPITAFAEVGSAFYYEGNDARLNELLQQEGLSEQQFGHWLKINKFIPEGESFEIDQVELDRTKAVWWTKNWSKEKAAEFFDVTDKLTYLQQNTNPEIDHYLYIPLYYKNEYQNYSAIYYYSATYNDYQKTDNPVVEEISDLIIEERLSGCLTTYGLSDWVPQHIISVEGFTFVLCEKAGQTIGVYMPTNYTTNYWKELHQSFSQQRTFNKAQFLTAMTTYEVALAEKNKNASAKNTGGGATETLEENTPPTTTVWMILGGVAFLTVAAVIVALLCSKKKL